MIVRQRETASKLTWLERQRERETETETEMKILQSVYPLYFHYSDHYFIPLLPFMLHHTPQCNSILCPSAGIFVSLLVRLKASQRAGKRKVYPPVCQEDSGVFINHSLSVRPNRGSQRIPLWYHYGIIMVLSRSLEDSTLSLCLCLLLYHHLNLCH